MGQVASCLPDVCDADHISASISDSSSLRVLGASLPKRDVCGESVVSSLPRELLQHVFGLLDVAERSRVSRVCRAWRDAALEPPHNTKLSLRLRHGWELRTDAKDAKDFQWPPEAWAQDPSALTEANLRLALRSPLARHVTSLSVALGRAAEMPLLGPYARRWPLRALVESLPAAVTRLEVAQSECKPSGGHDLYVEEQTILFAELGRLQGFAPQLRELVVRNEIPYGPSKWVPKHAKLELLDAGRLFPGSGDVLQLLPALKQCAGLYGSRTRDLAALAKRGLRVRSLTLDWNCLSQKGAVEAVSAVFQPKAAAFADGGLATLSMFVHKFPPGGFPDAFAAEAEQIAIGLSGLLQPSDIPFLAALARRPSLQVLLLESAMIQKLVSFRELLACFQGCREGLRIKLRSAAFYDVLHGHEPPAWGNSAGYVEACAFLTADRALLRAVDFADTRVDRSALPAVCRFRADKFDALAEHHPLDADELDDVRKFLADVCHARHLYKLENVETDEGRTELAMYESLERRARAHLPLAAADGRDPRQRAGS